MENVALITMDGWQDSRLACVERAGAETGCRAGQGRAGLLGMVGNCREQGPNPKPYSTLNPKPSG